MTRELERLEDDPKAEIPIDLLKKTLKNIKLENGRPWWNTWFLVQEIHLHSRQTCSRNEQMLTRSVITWLDEHIDSKGPKQRSHSKQLQTHNLPTNDVENINSTNKGRNLQLANKPWIRKDAVKDSEAQQSYIDQHILNESKTRSKN